MKELSLNIKAKNCPDNGINFDVTYEGETIPSLCVSGDSHEKREVIDILLAELKFMLDYQFELTNKQY